MCTTCPCIIVKCRTIWAELGLSLINISTENHESATHQICPQSGQNTALPSFSHGQSALKVTFNNSVHASVSNPKTVETGCRHI